MWTRPSSRDKLHGTVLMSDHMQDDKGRITGKGVADAVKSIRPVPLEAAWGLDCVLPKTGGGARVAAWWCPFRNQAMAELRLL